MESYVLSLYHFHKCIGKAFEMLKNRKGNTGNLL